MVTVPKIAAGRIVVVMPNWLGDGVMATPFLRALRGLYPGAHIAGVARPLVVPVLSGLPFVDEIFVARKGEEAEGQRWVRRQGFELGLVLPNSFRSAWWLFRGGVKRRLGYARIGAVALLTDRVAPLRRTAEQRQVDEEKAAAIRAVGRKMGRTVKVKVGSAYQPVPTVEYYLELARQLGATGILARRTELRVTEQERAEAAEAIQNSEFKIQNSATLVPGANFGSSKCWLPERFAAVADGLIEKRGMQVVIASSPAEAGIVDAILAASRFPGQIMALAKLNEGKGVSLGALKEIVRRSSLMVCNDTGPRHFAAAFGVPTVTLFGPTDPVWAETYHERERIVRVSEADAPCSPCQLKKCPIDHRCMTRLTVEMVEEAVKAVMGERGGNA